MTPAKIRPTKQVPRFERYNCTGKLRVDVKLDNNEVTEVILLPKKGGCKTLQQCIGKLITAMLECNLDVNFILEVLDSVDPCTAPKDRVDYKEGKITKEAMGLGGCPRIIAQAIKEKLNQCVIPKQSTDS